MKKIGFIGVGIMGKPMVRNLMKAGFEVSVYARNKEKIADVIAEGAVFRETIAELAKEAEAVITMVGFPPDVEEIYFGHAGILENAGEGTYLIDMTTTSPSLDKRIYEEGKKRGLHVLDAPVTGGDVGAIKGTLSILAGGDRPDFDACMPVFQAVGNNINYMGPSGSGQHAKAANQIAVAGTIAGICEAFAYAEKEGLDTKQLFQAISTGAAGSMQMDTNGAKIVDGDYSPGFRLMHLVKDLDIAVKEAEKAGLRLDVLKAALVNCRETEKQGYGEEGSQVLIRHYI